MARQRRLSDIPDFLHTSPFLPVGTRGDSHDPIQKVQVKPSLGQIIRSKHFRTVVVFIVIALVLLTLPTKIRNYHSFARLGISGPKCYFTDPVTIPSIPEGEVDWSHFAYTQYATTPDALCSSLMLFSALHQHSSRADRLLLYTPDLLSSPTATHLLSVAQNIYEVKPVLVEKQHKNNVHYIWADSYTKLLAFNQTQYKRLIHLDSDSTLRGNIDALFFLPSAEAVLPRAYWLEKPKLSSHIMVLQPSTMALEKIQKAIEEATRGTYDMEIINSLFGNECAILPHREYALLTGEFRSPDPKHMAFVDGKGEWDPAKVMQEAKFVHFSDYPFPKPWEETSAEEQEKVVPACVVDEEGKVDCRARDIWIELYKDFKAGGRTYVVWMTPPESKRAKNALFKDSTSKFRFHPLHRRNPLDPRRPYRIRFFLLHLDLQPHPPSVHRSRGGRHPLCRVFASLSSRG